MNSSPVAAEAGNAHESRVRLLVGRKIPRWRACSKKFPLGKFRKFRDNLVFGFSLPEAFLHPVGPDDDPGFQFGQSLQRRFNPAEVSDMKRLRVQRADARYRLL